jgi:hypothetical protein
MNVHCRSVDTSVATPLAQVLPHPQLIFPSKTWFFEIYLNFEWQKSLENQCLPHSQSKSYQINSIKSCSSRSFQEHKGTFQFLQNFQLQFNFFSVKKSFNIQKLLHCKSKRHGTKPMHPSSCRAFQRHQEHGLKHPSWVDLIPTTQNKLPFFIDRSLFIHVIDLPVLVPTLAWSLGTLILALDLRI